MSELLNAKPHIVTVVIRPTYIFSEAQFTSIKAIHVIGKDNALPDYTDQ